MTNFRTWFLICGALLWAGVSTAGADTLNGSNGSWQTWNAATTLGSASAPTYAGPYWNHQSGDGAADNVGWCLTGGGGCTIANPPGAIPYFGNGTGAVNNMWFSSGGSGVTVSLQGVFTSQTSAATAGIDYFGYYIADSTGAPVAGTFQRLIAADSSIPATASFSVAANQNYGFYLENVQGQGSAFETDYWFYMDSTQNVASNSATLLPLQHFAIFDGGGSMYLGIEDGWSATPDADYNDMIVAMTATPDSGAPEPASTALVVLGFLSIALYARRKLARS